MEQIIWGMIGCGDVTEVKSGPAFGKIEGSRLLAVMRRDKNKAKDYAERHNVPYYFNDADKIINHPEINAVYIATPPGSHAEYTIKALQSGKAVYVEKPMALNYIECRKMIEASEKAKVPLFVAYYRRSLDYFNKVKQLVDDNEIGKVRAVSITFLYPPDKEDSNSKNLPWRVIPEISGGGYFVDLASHKLDILDYILGPIKDAYGITANQAGLYKAEDIVSASLKFESGVIGSGIWCFSSYKKIDEIIIAGDRGSIRFGCFNFSPIALNNEKGDFRFELKPPQTIQYQLINSIVLELQGKGKSPSNCYTGIRTTLVMDKILGHA
jgi:predicted dehydrogenase